MQLITSSTAPEELLGRDATQSLVASPRNLSVLGPSFSFSRALVSLQLSQVGQQRGSLVRRQERAIDHEAVRRKKWRQVGCWIQPSRAPEESVVVVEHLLECCSGIVVKIRSCFANAAQLGYVHHGEVRRLAGQQCPKSD